MKFNPTKKIRQRVFKKNSGRCVYCSKQLQNTNPRKSDYMTIDHVIPKSAGGPKNRIDNLVPACNDCNSKKADHCLLEWIDILSTRRLHAAV